MATLRSVAEMRARVAEARRGGATIGLVPTMGALHDGHLSLIRRARERCDLVVVSLFVNPAQFNESTDLERYPRDETGDAHKARGAGADVLFAPGVEEVYPAGFSTSVQVSGPLTERLEGRARGAAHFHGVTTVVAKLLAMVAPDVAFFGQKDAQQVLVIRRMASDLNLPVRIEALPTVRDADGLALSSRNALLAPADRERALALSRALGAARSLAGEGELSAAAITARAAAVLAERGITPEYLELVDPDTLEPLARLDRDALLAVAARVGDIRLIDNAILAPAHARGAEPTPPKEAPTPCSA
ncbi:MAG TPA: pantoate--beta-alanine ligase [Solirubrobacteraceae bacterium]|jgi:pantoate--beta-alanine ligase|nr:pantoate--beta-alanine ligase [Solirubrobacteraceae bacterium]